MSDDKNETEKQASGTDASKAAAAETNRSEEQDTDLEEELDEAFPGSDAPASTRRTSNK